MPKSNQIYLYRFLFEKKRNRGEFGAERDECVEEKIVRIFFVTYARQDKRGCQFPKLITFSPMFAVSRGT